MSLQVLAQDMASRGRGPDSMLVHMAPREVAGLQALALAHGGSLTVNPQTGLPEAGFLRNILPTLIGAGLTIASGGALSPLMAAGLVGGGTALATGSLKKGLMAGLGAYGGAGLGGGLAGVASASPELAAQALGTTAATGPGSQAAMLAAQNAGFGTEATRLLADSAGVAAGATPVVPSAFSQAGQGLSALTTEAGRNAFMQNVGGSSGLLKYGAAAAAPMVLGSGQAGPGYEGSGPNPYEYTYDYKTGQYTRVAPGTRDSMGGIYPNVPILRAEGGTVEAMSDRNAQETFMANGGQMFAQGGYTLGDYSDGGRLLRGPGDGVSDDIPAMIADKRPARLADGEFVVPARIVSELGNGSTDAGARKLYAMMDRVQQARNKTTGKGKVAVNSRADKLLPA